ncbi:hypothetical protein QCA50_007519 [Cerrena zonata]|uniref:Uncharacterized protein n=1 Tax=Cerrena zonata TaxID=2478898 RepID=A0AAW0G5T3_9APHY
MNHLGDPPPHSIGTKATVEMSSEIVSIPSSPPLVVRRTAVAIARWLPFALHRKVQIGSRYGCPVVGNYRGLGSGVKREYPGMSGRAIVAMAGLLVGDTSGQE